MTEHQPRIFLCHASEDKARVEALYHQLQAAGYHPWLDKHDLLPGQDWWTEIERVISDPFNLVVVCLSDNSTSKRGVVQREIARALDVLEEMPEETIYLIPARLEACQVPRRLVGLHWVNLFEPGGFERLRGALDFEIGRREVLAEPVQASPSWKPVEPEMVLIPGGEFLMGSDLNQDQDASRSEWPQHTIHLPDYTIARTPVTNAEYAAFVEATRHRAPIHWKGGRPPGGKEDHPVVLISWHGATAYCKWLARNTGKAYRLPSEAEWEKAARGTDGRIYPWGNEPPDEKRCNFDNNVGDTTPVGQYSPQGDSPYGVTDMAGNVWEWTRSLWGRAWEEPGFRYPYAPGDGRENPEAGDDVRRLVRGGAFDHDSRVVRCAYRYRNLPDDPYWFQGFRVCLAPRQD
jgi:formylglycine-generating enzyme required for sulfatase activity